MFAARVADGVLRFGHEDARWLTTGWDGGYADTDAAFNVTVPTGFDRTDLAAYARERRHRAGFEDPGPTLLTGVEMKHARGARAGPVQCIATAGVSNPATLPMDADSKPLAGTPNRDGSGATSDLDGSSAPSDQPGAGTVNLLLGTTRALDDGTLATLLATAVEAKTATLLDATGFTGTTTDAVAVGTVRGGEPASFAGSGTEIGTAARACVRDAVLASLGARYADTPIPGSVAEADHGRVTDARASIFRPEHDN